MAGLRGRTGARTVAALLAGRPMKKLILFVLVAPMLAGCLATAAIGVAGDVVGATVGAAIDVGGAVVGAVIPDGDDDDNKHDHH